MKKAQAECFIISPIGETGSDDHKIFKKVLKGIKRAVKRSHPHLKCERAEESSDRGEFIRSIISSLINSPVVIADLTRANPNVLYELGMRHALRAGCILIAQSSKDIPSDLKHFRHIIYELDGDILRETNGEDFGKKLAGYIDACLDDPLKGDSPIRDNFPEVGTLMEHGMARMWFSRDRMTRDVVEEALRDSTSICMLGFNLKRPYLKAGGILDTWLAQKKRNLRILVADPDSSSVRRRSEIEDYQIKNADRDRIANGAAEALQYLAAIPTKKLAPESVRVLEADLIFNSLIIGREDLFYTPYFASSRGSRAPTYHVAGAKSTLYQLYNSEFGRLWDNFARPVDLSKYRAE